MTKVPRAGNVKTRLQPFLSAGQCQMLAEVFLYDSIEKTFPLCDRLIVAFEPSAERNYFAGFDPEKIMLVDQRGADLGEKMRNAFASAFELNIDSNVVMIGTDSPTFPPAFIEKSFEQLETGAETVLGRSDDGGFYLIGLKKVIPSLFDKIEWSSPQVFDQITQNINELKISLELVPDWYDVDTPEDLERLKSEFQNSKNARKLAPETFKYLTSILNSYISDRESRS